MIPLVRGASLSRFTEVAQQFGLEPNAMLRRFEIDRQALSSSDIMIPTAKVLALLESAAQESKCETFGLLMAERRQVADLGVLSLLVTHQPTMREALETLVRYRRLLNESLIIQIEELADVAVIRQELLAGGQVEVRQGHELAIGVLHQLMRKVRGPRWRPLSVHFPHAAPGNLAVHHRIFGPIVEFNSDFTGLTCPLADLDAANQAAEPGLAQFAERFVRSLPNAEGDLLSRDVQKAIYLMLPTGQANIERVAGRVGLNGRTLQRRLAEEGEEFSQLLNEVRRELADRYVANGALPLGRIAGLVGFSRQSSFSRWFSGEFGRPPARWRADALASHRGAS